MKIMMGKVLPGDSIPCESLNSLDMDYDLWQGQFEIIAPYTEITNNNSNDGKVMNGNNFDTHLNGNVSINNNSNSHGSALNNNNNYNISGNRSMMTSALPITQILDSEDVFLSLHPSDFESLNIAAINNNNVGSPPTNGGEDAASIITRRQQQWNALFPKSSVQSLKSRESNNQLSNDGNVFKNNINAKNSNNNNSTTNNVGATHNKSETSAGETETLQHRLCEQVRCVLSALRYFSITPN